MGDGCGMKQNRRLKIIAGALTGCVLGGILFGYDILSGAGRGAYETNAAQISPQEDSAEESEIPAAVSSEPAKKDETVVLTEELQNSVVPDPAALKNSIASPYAVLVRVGDGKILFEKNAGERIYPASMTKIMTVLLAIEESPNLTDHITVTQTIFDRMLNEDASMAGFLPGESVSVEDLLYGALLPSGAECCAALAERLQGTEEAFAEQMNLRAAALGLSGTHFTNTTGLHDPQHYSTARDIAALLCAALKNETFRRIFTTDEYTSSPTNLHPQGLSFESTMFYCLNSAQAGKATILGGKVGFTDQAGLCLASLAVQNGTEYVLVTAGVNNLYRGEIHDAVAVYSSLCG